MDAMLPNEVSLLGQRYPLWGLVKRKSLTPFPPKTSSGDYTREDRIVESEWVVSDLSGGLGIHYARAGRDDDRSAFGDLEARYRFLTLGPEVVDVPGLSGPVDRFITYNERLFAAQGNLVFQWSETAKSWTQSTTIAGPTRDAAVYDGMLYLLTDTALYRFDGAGNVWSTFIGFGGHAILPFDDKLYRLDLTNQLSWSITPSANAGEWVAAGRLLLPPGYCRQLLTYWDQTGEPAIHAITQIGVLGYDQNTERFYPTPLTYPPVPGAGQGACVWQSVLYVPVGPSVYRYTGTVVESTGPDKDDGLPNHLRGNVTRMVAGHGFVFAVVNAAQILSGDMTPPIDVGFHTPDTFFPSHTSNGGILASPGSSWHLLTQRINTAQMGDAIVAAVEGSFRLWFSDGDGVHYVTQPVGLHNPMQNPTHRYASTGFIDTPWNDMKWAEVDKVALSLDLETVNTSESETIEVYLAWDETETWEKIGTASAPGRSVFRVGDTRGRLFRTVKMRIVMNRGSDVTKTPLLRSAVLGYLRVPPSLDGWEIDLDLTEPRCSEEIGVPAGELVEQLYTAKRAKAAGTFSYQDSQQVRRDRRVWLHEVVGSELTGDQPGGRYTVTLLELDT